MTQSQGITLDECKTIAFHHFIHPNVSPTHTRNVFQHHITNATAFDMILSCLSIFNSCEISSRNRFAEISLELDYVSCIEWARARERSYILGAIEIFRLNRVAKAGICLVWHGHTTRKPIISALLLIRTNNCLAHSNGCCFSFVCSCQCSYTFFAPCFCGKTRIFVLDICAIRCKQNYTTGRHHDTLLHFDLEFNTNTEE